MPAVLVAVLVLMAFTAGNVLAALPADAPLPPGLYVLESTDDSLLLELRVPPPVLDTIVVDGQEFDTVRLDEQYEWTETVGRPLLPLRNELVGIPDLSTVQIELVAVEESRLPGDFTLYPVPEVAPGFVTEPGQRTVDPVEPQALGTELRFAFDADFYAQDTLYPAEIVEITSKGYMRDQLVARLRFYPLRTNPARRELWFASRIQVRLYFDAPARLQATATEANTSVPRPDPLAPRTNSFDEALSSTLLNYQQALPWRIPRSQAQVLLGPGMQGQPAAPNTGGQRYRVETIEPGLTEISYAALAAAGAPVDDIDPATIRLEKNGTEIAIEVTGSADGSFDPDDRIRFYAEAIDSIYTWRNVYWLSFGGSGTFGRRVNERLVFPHDGVEVADFPTTVHVEESTYYQSELPREGFEADRWYWTFTRWRSRGAVISRTVTFQLGTPSPIPHLVTIRPNLRGATSFFLQDPDHYVLLYVNGHLIGEATWDGYAEFQDDFVIDSALLHAGTNTFTLETPGQPGVSEDVAFLNWLEIEYRQAFQAVDNQLWFTVTGPGPRSVQVDGFSSANVALYDVTDPYNIVRLPDFSVTEAAGSYQVAFTDKLLDGPQRYLVTTEANIHSPIAVERDNPSDLRSPASGADYLIITHADFLPAAQALADYRATTGFVPRVIDVQDIYDEFSEGLLTPVAIRDFLAYAYVYWPEPAPAYVLLLGDGTYDFKNYLGFGADTYIPPYLDAVDPFLGETASDNRYVTIVGGDPLPDLHIGRMPANSLAEAWTMVNKTIDYETTPPPGDWRYNMLFATDNADVAGNFPYLSNEVADYLVPPPYRVNKVYYGDNYQDILATRAAIKAAINDGVLFANYVGHSSITWWAAEILLGANDVSSLNNDNRLPVMLPMTCFEGYFQSPVFASLAETLVRAAGRGAVASWSATGQGVATGHDYLHRGFYEAVFYGGVQRLGPATLAGKLKLFTDDYRFHDLIDTYGLLGDPALALNLPDADLAVEMAVTPEGPVQQGDWLTYTISYRNEGVATVPNAVLTSAVPSALVNVTMETSSPAASLRSGNRMVWDLGPLAAGQGGWITITGQVPDVMGVLDAPYSAGSRVVSVWRESDTANNKGGPLFVPVLESDMAVSLQAQAAAAVPGDSVSLTLTYRNNGPAAATTPHLWLPLPAWLQNPAFAFGGPEPVLQPGDALRWDLPTLASGQSGIITVTGTLAPDLTASSLPLEAEAHIATDWLDTQPANDSSYSLGPPVYLLDPYEPDDDRSQATAISASGISAGHTDSYYGDVDWFRFPAQAGRRYRIRTENLSAGGDTLLSLYDSSGLLLAKNDDYQPGSGWSSLDWTARADAAYYVAVRAAEGSAPAYTYDLRIEMIPHQVFLPALVAQ